MNVSSLASPISGVSSPYSASPTTAVQTDDGDSDGGQVQRHHGHGHGHGGGGQLSKDLTSALDSIGLTVPPSSGATASPADPSAGSGSGSADGGSGNTLQSDMKHFMQTLVQAVKGESSAAGTASTPGVGSANSADPKTSFASGLSALISQVASGNAPQGLQDAFSKLASDVTAVGASSSSSSSPSSPSSSSSSSAKGTQATLQALLTALQQNTGYSTRSGTSAVGNLISTQV